MCDKVTAVVEFNPDINKFNELLSSEINGKKYLFTIRFLDLQISKKIFKKTILNLKFKIPARNIILFWAGILNFKFKIVFWNFFF